MWCSNRSGICLQILSDFFVAKDITSLVRIQALFILFEHFTVMKVSATKTLVQRWTYKWVNFTGFYHYFRWIFCLHLPRKGSSILLQNVRNYFYCCENLRSHWNCRLFPCTAKLNVNLSHIFFGPNIMFHSNVWFTQTFLKCSNVLT
jgi:hypothetical protein